MENISSVIEMGRIALDFESFRVAVAAENISNINVPGAPYKTVESGNFLQVLDSLMKDTRLASSPSAWSADGSVKENYAIHTSLDSEVFNISASEQRYQTIAQAIKVKLGILEIAQTGRGK